jgi:hypothetical protein
MCPFEALYGFIPETPVMLVNPSKMTYDVHERLQEVQALVRQNMEMAKEFQRLHAERGQTPRFVVGDMVKLDATHINLRDQPAEKLKDRWIGPFQVTEMVGPMSYRLALPPEMECYPVFHVSKLASWRKDAEHPEHIQPTKPLRARGDILTKAYEVEAIRDVCIDNHSCKPNGKVLLFLVRWKDYDPTHDSWEPYGNVKRLDALKEFFNTRKWKKFSSSSEYAKYKKAYPSRVPTLS